MAGRKRVLGFSRAFAPGAFACAVWGATACSMGSDSHEPYGDGLGGGFESGASGGFGVLPNPPELGGGVAAGVPEAIPCIQEQVPKPVFADQVFNSNLAGRRELFSWTTDEQAAALRKDQVLFTTVEQAGLGPGYAFTHLKELAETGTDPEQVKLAGILTGSLFEKKRYAWSEPWATRMGWPGEEYGGQLLRVVLRPEAWVVVVKGGSLSVVDLDNQPVSITEALTNPTRFGAILYVKDASDGGPICGGSFFGGGNGYREFILGNLAMVEEWSIGTQQIRDRLASNIEQLTHFLTRMRSCPTTTSPAQWNLSVVCSWDSSVPQPVSEVFAYEQSLAIPSPNYVPVPAQLATMIDTLSADLFEPDPLIVMPNDATPGSP